MATRTALIAKPLIHIEKMTLKKPYTTIALWLLLAGFSGSLLLFSGLYLYLSPKLPPVESLRQVKLQTPLRIYSSDNKLIGEFGEKRRDPIRYEEIPHAYIDAILAAEDDQFYSHHGVSIKGLLRAASQLLQTGHIQTGGSTITMQVARNFFLTRKQTFARKFNEILLALQIEQKLTKEEILELYVNKIYLGNRAYGIQAAARVYYGKDISELNLAQLAMIAGLPKAPSAYNPLANPERSLVRRNWILGRMLELGAIDQLTHDHTVQAPITASYHGLSLDLDAPYVAEMARKKALEQFGESAYTDGYQITTTIDSRLQASAEQALRKGLMTYDQRHGYRGPEMQLQPEASEDGHTDTDHWLEALQSQPQFANLLPAAITSVGEQEVEALLGSGENILIPWENGLKQARPYITENQLGSKPKTAAKLFQVGDVIRVYMDDDGGWHLSQIPAAQAALVALNPEDGGIRSLVGGFDFHQSHFNRATQAARQPGSNFKPFIYTAALENGFTAASLVNDAPIVVDDASLEGTWRPENSSGKFLGPTRLRQALYQSRNLVSIRVLRSIGVPKVVENMDRFGFDEDKLPRDLSLALGSYALTPLQVATGYAIFANGGYKVEPYLVKQIHNLEGELVYEHLPLTVCRDCEENAKSEQLESTESDATSLATSDQPAAAFPDHREPESGDMIEESSNLEELLGGEPSAVDTESSKIELIDKPELPRAPRVLDEKVAYIIDSMLRDVVQKGTGRRARVLGRMDLAGKTGTTNGPTDAWFSGYTPQIVTTTWLGFDQNLLLGRREFGGSAALPIWIDFMRTALEGLPEVHRTQPDGLVTVRIDPETGERALPDNPGAIFEIFRTDMAPKLAGHSSNGHPELASPEEEILPEELF